MSCLSNLNFESINQITSWNEISSRNEFNAELKFRVIFFICFLKISNKFVN